MELLSAINVRKINRSRIQSVDFNNLEFGKYVSDHMLVCDFADGEWNQAQILPFSNLSLSPTALALHYGQTVFEGMKAFRMSNGDINVFRMERHYERFVRSLQRMCMAYPSRELFIDGIVQLIELDKAWVPERDGASLYLRPFVYASEAKFGIKVSEQYRFVIFTGPVPDDLYVEPLRVKVETEYTRAGRGGTGAAKCGGNYGGALYPTQLAKQKGYDQLLWTRGEEEPFIEESGMMNVMFVIDNVLVTPPLSDSILDGITRESILILAADLGISVEERPIAVSELQNAFYSNNITEAFGAGTAAVVAPIQTIHINGRDFHLPAYSENSLFMILKQKLLAIRRGEEADLHEWNYIVK